MPIDDDDIVTVEELPDVLSAAEKAILQQQITHYDALTEEWMIQSFTTAKVFVHAAAT